MAHGCVMLSHTHMRTRAHTRAHTCAHATTLCVARVGGGLLLQRPPDEQRIMGGLTLQSRSSCLLKRATELPGDRLTNRRARAWTIKYPRTQPDAVVDLCKYLAEVEYRLQHGTICNNRLNRSSLYCSDGMKININVYNKK